MTFNEYFMTLKNEQDGASKLYKIQKQDYSVKLLFSQELD